MKFDKLVEAYMQVVNEEKDVRIYDVKRRATKSDLQPYIDWEKIKLEDIKGAWVVYIQEDWDKNDHIVVEYKTPKNSNIRKDGPFNFGVYHIVIENPEDNSISISFDGYAKDGDLLVNAIKEWEVNS